MQTTNKLKYKVKLQLINLAITSLTILYRFSGVLLFCYLPPRVIPKNTLYFFDSNNQCSCSWSHYA